ncbi:serine hydrolase domain-containing protein [Psychrobacter alimentarius]|uniref:serine hydrolase domain-containing protein n=1 Tax=Psychrobacter alimentarius TaxID=261164 RepID=UPI00191870E0|nr:serine hydrolase domain-containing protein [Psychrobacter alimentarius]
MTGYLKENNQNVDRQINTEFQQRLQQLLTDLQLEDGPAGGALVVYQAGKCVAKASTGMARSDMLWQPDTLAINFSTGKGVLATLVHVLVSTQLLNYDAPIASYWPAFAANGKKSITLRSVLSHQANLFSIQSIDADSETMLDWAVMLEKVAAMPVTSPANADAYDSAYSALIYGWVLGGMIEAVTNMSLAKALRHYLTEPLGIADSCYFGVPDDKVEQVATLVQDFDVSEDEDALLRHKRHNRKPVLKPDSQSTLQKYQNLPSYLCWQQQTVNNKKAVDNQNVVSVDKHNELPKLDTARITRLYFDTSQLNLRNYKAALIPASKQPIDYHKRETIQAVIPAANGVASADALATIYAMLANGGEWQGKTLIDHNTFQQLSTPQVTGLDAVMPAPMQWRLGYHRVFSLCARETTEPQLAGFGHMGYNGSVAWCDPSRQLSFAFIHNFDTTMLNDIRQFALTEAVLLLIDEAHPAS